MGDFVGPGARSLEPAVPPLRRRFLPPKDVPRGRSAPSSRVDQQRFDVERFRQQDASGQGRSFAHLLQPASVGRSFSNVFRGTERKSSTLFLRSFASLTTSSMNSLGSRSSSRPAATLP